MAVNLKDKTIIVRDYGEYFYIAEKLAESFGKVYYYVPYEDSFPLYNAQLIGKGIQGVERIYSFWDHLAEADVIMFPDLFEGDLQDYLREQGHNVFGAVMGEELEIYRPESKQLLQTSGLPVGEYEVVYGLDALRERLKTVEDKYIKMNVYLRGQMETWHHENYALSNPILNKMDHDFGIAMRDEPIIIETPIPALGEIGYDGAVVDGKFLKASVIGIEAKDEGYVGKFTDYDKLPHQIKEANDKLASVFKDYGYRGWYSNEIRVSKEDKKGYLVDFTCRCPEPNMAVAVEAYANYGEIVWDIAHGNVPNVKKRADYAVECIIHSDWLNEEPQPVSFPPDIRQWVKLKNHAIIDGVDYAISQKNDSDGVGALVFCSASLDDAILECEFMAKKIKGYHIEINTSSLKGIKENIDELYKNGIKIFG